MKLGRDVLEDSEDWGKVPFLRLWECVGEESSLPYLRFWPICVGVGLRAVSRATLPILFLFTLPLEVDAGVSVGVTTLVVPFRSRLRSNSKSSRNVPVPGLETKPREIWPWRLLIDTFTATALAALAEEDDVIWRNCAHEVVDAVKVSKSFGFQPTPAGDIDEHAL